MLSLRIEDKFTGPTIVEIEPLFSLSSEPFDVRWEGTKQEKRLARKYKDRPLTLVVPNLAAMEKAAATLGLGYDFDRGLMVTGKNSLANKDGKWRDFTRDNGSYVARGTVLKGLATMFRKGGPPSKDLRQTVVNSVLDQIQPIDLDVLLLLRLKGARV
jgi:hypothetical protein